MVYAKLKELGTGIELFMLYTPKGAAERHYFEFKRKLAMGQSLHSGI